jgi:hypothetical protein
MEQIKNKKNQKAGKILKICLIALGSLAVLAGTGTIGYVIGRADAAKAQEKEDDAEPSAEVTEAMGIKLQTKYHAQNAAGDAYGSYEITYKVDPVIFTDTIEAELKYQDGTAIGTDILSFDHDTANMKVTVHCKKVFTKKAVLTLYAKSDPNVKAVVTFDFKERIVVTMPDSISLNEGAVPAIDPKITTTGGTVAIDKNPASKTYKWNTSFITWVNKQAKAAMDEETESMQSNCSTWTEAVGDLVGLSDADCKTFFTEAFSSTAFLTTKGQKYSYHWQYSDDDADVDNLQETTWHLGEAARADFLAEFDGKQPIIDFSCTVNGTKYEKTFGLSLSAIPVKGITTSKTTLVF